MKGVIAGKDVEIDEENMEPKHPVTKKREKKFRSIGDKLYGTNENKMGIAPGHDGAGYASGE